MANETAVRMRVERRMPARIQLGQRLDTTMGHPMMQWENWRKGPPSNGSRYVMGYRLPSWQRPLVWTDAQKVAFIESAWRGINLGTYSYNMARHDSPYDDLLIDGQQRLSAIEGYLLDEFTVLGWRWSEVTETDQRLWEMGTTFACLRTTTEDEAYLRNYYNLLNFGGTAHKESEKA